MATKVVNLRDKSYDQYIGRAGRGHDGYFGNPVAIGKKCPVCKKGHYRAGATLQCYETYLVCKLQDDKEFNRRFYELKGKTLGCFCKPGPCHGDVMADYLDNKPAINQKEFPMSKTKTSKTLVIFADGGCEGNHQADKSERNVYASVAVKLGDKQLLIRPDWVEKITGLKVRNPRQILTMQFPKLKSNNEAEFAAAIMALGYVEELERRNPNKDLPDIVVRMDNKLVVGAINGEKNIKAKNLKPLFNRFKEIADAIPLTIAFEWVPRQQIATVLGH